MTVVVGTDLSEAARGGVDAAAYIAHKLGDRDVRLVQVVEPQGADDETLRRQHEAAEERLAIEAKRAGALAGGEIRPYLLLGSPWQVLVDFAAAEKARLLVVAASGHGSSPLYRLGSTSERVAQSCTVPVLVVRDAAPFAAWSRGERALEALVGVDESSASTWACRFVESLRQAAPCNVVVGHIYRADEVRRRYGLPPRLSVVDPEPEAERLLARDFARALGEPAGSGKLEYRMQLGLGRIGDLVVDLARDAGVDLIVVGTHRRRGLSRIASTTNVVLHYAETSVVVVPAPIDELAPTIPDFRSVLVTTDLSPFSNHAVPHAYGLLGVGGGDVHLIHVCNPRTSADARSELRAQLKALVPRAAAVRSVTTHIEVIADERPQAAILAAAERVGADVVCLSSHARGGVRGAILGSVANDVVSRSRRPVLVVRPPGA